MSSDRHSELLNIRLMINLNKRQWLLIILMLVSIACFGIQGWVNRPLTNALCTTVFLYFFWIEYKNLKKTISGRFLYLYLLFFFISCIYSIVFNGQKPISIYSGVIVYMGLGTFAICYHNKFSYKEVKKVMFVFAVIFCLSYIFQWMVYPQVWFDGAGEDSWSEERFRMRLPASLSSFYLFLTGVKYFSGRQFVKATPLIVLGGIPIIVMGFRSLTFMALVASVGVFSFSNKISWKSLLSVCAIVVAAFAISNTSLFKDKLQEMSDRQETETFANDDYIRFVELAFYQDKLDKPGEWLFGSGVPCGVSSSYSRQMQSYQDMGMYWQDLGLVGLSFVIGIITVCLLVFWSLRMMLRCGHSDLIVERFTMFVALFGSIMTSMEYFRAGNFMILGLLFYCEYRHNIELGAPNKKWWLKKSDYPNYKN